MHATQFGLEEKGTASKRFLLAASTIKHFSMYDLEGYIPRTDPTPRPPSSYCDTPGGCERWNFDANPSVTLTLTLTP